MTTLYYGSYSYDQKYFTHVITESYEKTYNLLQEVWKQDISLGLDGNLYKFEYCVEIHDAAKLNELFYS